MSNKNLPAIIGISSLFFSTMTLAASNKSLSKDEWLTIFKQLAPTKICQHLVDDKDANKLLARANINYDKCLTLLPGSIDKCQNKLYSEIPSRIDSQNESKWGTKLGNCIGMDFFSNNFLAKPDTNSSTTNTTTSTSTNTTTPPATSSNEMSKEEWLNDLTVIAPKLICGRLDKSFHKRLSKKGITFDKCLTLMPNSVDVCEKKYTEKMPMTLDKKNQKKWGNTLGECIGNNFSKNFLK